MLTQPHKHVLSNPPMNNLENFTAIQGLEVGDAWYMLDTPWLDTFICEYSDDTQIVIKRVIHRNVSEDC